MKVITSIARILVGGLFIFSGFIKSNDPKGTGYKFNEYFNVFASSFEAEQDTINFEVNCADYEIHEFYNYSLGANETSLKMEMNQSKIYKTKYDEDPDSVSGSDIHVVKNGGDMYSYFFELDSTLESPKMTLKVYLSGSKKDILLEITLEFTAFTKHEFEKEIDLKPYVHKNGFFYNFFKSLIPFSLILAIVMCILEIVLGFAILIGWQPKIMTWLILGMIVFFTFLTWYSAYYNKVTDCGCFGDFLKLEPWTSFYKDVVLLVLILIIFIRRKHIVPLFSPLFNINAMIVVILASSTFAIYCNMFLPAWDFLPYKAGNNIRDLMTPPKGALLMDSTESVLIYKKGDQYDSLVFPNMPKDTSWKYVNRIDRVLKEGWKSPIHDFDFSLANEDGFNLNDTLLHSKGYHIMIVSTHFEKSNQKAWEKVKQLAIDAKASGIGFYAVTASPLESADVFCNEKQLPFKFRSADETLLKTIVRSNPGVILWHDGTVMDKWSFRSIPSIKKIKKFMK
jgi:uncharacterized membrane protein YphA (DoxX/SURF4 family)